MFLSAFPVAKVVLAAINNASPPCRLDPCVKAKTALASSLSTKRQMWAGVVCCHAHGRPSRVAAISAESLVGAVAPVGGLPSSATG